jgi:hypothetical protein
MYLRHYGAQLNKLAEAGRTERAAVKPAREVS